MGAGPSKLFLLIIFEGLILAVLSFIIGITLSHVAMWLMSESLSEAYKYDFDAFMFIKKEWSLLGLALLLGFIASIIPAFRAYKTDIHQTLSKM